MHIDVAVIGTGEKGVWAVINRDALLLENMDNFSILPAPLKRDPNYLGFSKKSNMQHFLAAFNQGLAECKTSGEYQLILDKYMGE